MNKDFSFQQNNKLVLKTKGILNFIEMDKITHLTCEGSLTTVYTINNSDFVISKILKHFERELLNFGFIRANNNTIVNMMHVKEIKSSPNLKMYLTNDIEIKISRRKLYLFNEFIEKQEVF